MRTRVSFIADTHAGSDTGLFVGDSIATPNGSDIHPTPASRWLAGLFHEHLQAEAEAAKDHDRHVLVFVGDVCDGGLHHKNLNHYHADPSVEKMLARRIVEAACEALDPDLIFVVLGSSSHVGHGGEREEAVGSWLVAKYGEKVQRPDEHRFGWGRIKAEWGGVKFDVKHEGRMGRLEVTRESYFVRNAAEIYLSYAMYEGVDWIPDVAVRAHNHKYVATAPVAPHKRGVQAFGLPCYQLSTYWANQKFETTPDVGMLGLTCEAGRVRDVFAQVVTPRTEEPVWTP